MDGIMPSSAANKPTEGGGRRSRAWVRLVIRVHGGLARVVGPGLAGGTEVAVREYHVPAAPAGDPPPAPVVNEAHRPEAPGDIPDGTPAAGPLEVRQVEVRHEPSVVGQPRAGTGDQAELVADVVQA